MFHWYWLALVGVMANTGTGTPDDYTIVVFGANANNAVVLVSLLSDDGNLVVERRNDEVIVVNPANAAWTPDSKYIVCDDVQPERIAERLSELTKPLRFVVAFDASDMFAEPFWNMIIYLAKYVSEDKISSNQLRMVAMDLPHDGISLERHCDELKQAIKNGLQPHSAVDFQMVVVGMHSIEKTGPVSEMPELVQELIAVRNGVDRQL